MRSHRGGWLGSWVLGAILAVAPAVSTTVHAQPGFGPDPFWPYNKQYTPYTTPIGPASPDAGQGSPGVGRQGYSGANQFRQYMDELSSPGRNNSDRAGVGMPYYRGSVDPSYYPAREYRPNAQPNERFEETQRKVTEKYFKYFSERDPRRRAELLREYQRARRDSSRSMSPRAQSPSGVLDAVSRARPESGSSRASGTPRDDASGSAFLPSEPGTTSRSETSATRSGTAAGSARGQGRTLRPAPPVPAVTPAPGNRSRSSPSGVLNRARSMDDRNGRTSGSTSATSRSRRTDRSASPAVPRTYEEP